MRTVEVWRRLGVDADCIDLATGRIGVTGIGEEDSFRPRFRAEWIFEMHRRAKRLRRALEVADPDLVYTRELVWSPGLKSILDGFPVVIEVNSDRGEELRRQSRAASMFWRMTVPGIRRRAAGMVAVTGELLDRTLPSGVSGLVITNGTSVASTPPIQADSSPKPVILMLLGRAASWHGLDRLSLLADALPEFEFVVCGDLGEESKDLSAAIRKEPSRIGEDLTEILSEATVAVASLAISRNMMSQACPLKSRTCLAAGLPLIYGYEDPDLDGGEAFALRIRDEHWTAGVAVDRVRDFVGRVSGDAEIRLSAWRHAREHFDHSVVERRRVEFFESIVAGRDGIEVD